MSLRLSDCISEEVRQRKIEQALEQHHSDIQQILRRLSVWPDNHLGQLPKPADAFQDVTGGEPTGDPCINNIAGFLLSALEEDNDPAFFLGISSTGCLVKVPVGDCEDEE